MTTTNTTTTTRVPVSGRAALQRINRALAAGGTVLRACKQSSRWYRELGNFYEVDLPTNSITAKHVELEPWARELKVLKDYEFVAE